MNHSLPEQNPASKPQSAFSRRTFLRRAGIASATAAVAPVAAAVLLNPSKGMADDASDLDIDVLNFALNLEFVESEFYSYATTGKSIEEQFGIDTSGVGGAAGGLIVKPNITAVPFTNDSVAAFADEITTDEVKHVVDLQAALGSAAVARPTIDLYNSFNTLAVAAGIGSSFDPFASDIDFLFGGFIFEDVGVTAYHGAAPLITNKDYLSAAAGILAVEAYHASLLRVTLYNFSLINNDAAGIVATGAAISTLRATLGGGKDQNFVTSGGAVNIVPTPEDSIAFARNTKKVLNIVYGAKHSKGGLFFPNGMNGAIK